MPETTILYEDLEAEARYEALDESLEQSDVPDFQSEHTNEHGNLDTEECVAAMREWLDERINAGEVRSPYQNKDYRTISTRSNIKHWSYRDSPILPTPETMDSHGASCVNVSLTGTVVPETRYDTPQPKNDAYQHLWNVVTMFAHATDAEVQLTYSQSPKDSLEAYLFYDF